VITRIIIIIIIVIITILQFLEANVIKKENEKILKYKDLLTLKNPN